MAEKEYIEREAALRVLCDACGNAACPKCLIPRCSYYEKMQSIPAADVRTVVRGKWEDVEVTYVADKTTLPFERISSMRCNRCNKYHTEIYYYGNPTEMANFCPNCGADMREESNE